MAKKLRIFDFDDTLVKTKSFVYVTHEDGSDSKLTPAEFAVYSKQAGDEFDFRDFAGINQPSTIIRMFKAFKRYAGEANSDVVILTARAENSQPAIKKFLKISGISGIKVVTLGDSTPTSKSNWIKEKMMSGDYDNVLFLDDSKKNIDATQKMLSKYPEFKTKTNHMPTDHMHIIASRVGKGKTFKAAAEGVSENKKRMKLSELKNLIRQVIKEEKEKKYGYTNEADKDEMNEWGPNDYRVKGILKKWDSAVSAKDSRVLSRIAILSAWSEEDKRKIFKQLKANKISDAKNTLVDILRSHQGEPEEFSKAYDQIVKL
jgi:hypothetical protein